MPRCIPPPTMPLMEPSRKRGTITVVQGSMFAGKTERLIAFLREAQKSGRRVRAFKHAIDNRYDATHLVTHRNDSFPAIAVRDVEAILLQCEEIDCLAVDEGQFFGEALVDAVVKMRSAGKFIIIAGISHDAWGRPFDPMPQLSAVADAVEVQQSPCKICRKPAPYTQRMVPVTTPTMVGGLGDYEPRCAEHFTPLAGEPEQR